MPAGNGPAIEAERQWHRLLELGAIGGFTDPDGHAGVNRACLTAADRDARALLVGWAAGLGLTASIDPLANLFLRLEGTAPDAAPVLTGSHMDTQPNGGRFDGIYGVVAGLEAVAALRASGITPRRPIEIVAWTNEEGGRFAPGCMGSMAFAGAAPPDTWDAVQDRDGIRFADALAAHLAAEAALPRRPLGYIPHAYLEAHIEQGPLLEAEGLDIGIVSGIQGSRWFVVEITGKTDHAGTTPLAHRADAVQEMLAAITALNALMHDPADVLRFTVGSIAVSPDTSNSVAARARFTIDFRHPDAGVLRTRGDAVAGVIQAALRRCTAQVTERFHATPVAFDPKVTGAVDRAAAGLGCSRRAMPSGAFHDAQFLVPVCPTGMLFVPCRGGVSHHPSEYATPAALAAGTAVLAAALVELAE